MTRRIWLLLGMLLLIIASLAGTYLLSIAEPYEEQIDRGPSPEARANENLAAELFLRQQGRSVSRADGLDVLKRLPSKGQTLLLLTDRSRMTPRQADKLLAWTEQGGHLLFVAEELWDADEGRSGDLLLDRLGIQQYLSEDLDTLEAEPASAAPGARKRGKKLEADSPPVAAEEPFPELTKLYLENEQEPAYFGFNTDYHLYDSQNRAHAWANSAGATHMLQLYHGEGIVTVISDPWLWRNNAIAEHDNAWLLWYLTQDSAVTLLNEAERDDLLSLLLRNFPQALVAAGLLIALLLWQQGMRHGPALPAARPARRQLEEHLRGSADFLLRRSSQQTLILGLQQDILRRARRRHPGFERLAVADQRQILARLSRQPGNLIREALRSPDDKRQSAAHFTRQVACLQNLRNAL